MLRDAVYGSGSSVGIVIEVRAGRSGIESRLPVQGAGEELSGEEEVGNSEQLFGDTKNTPQPPPPPPSRGYKLGYVSEISISFITRG